MDKNMENNFSPYMNFDIGADPLLGEHPMSVSYTHLDVYKRQAYYY